MLFQKTNALGSKKSKPRAPNMPKEDIKIQILFLLLGCGKRGAVCVGNPIESNELKKGKKSKETKDQNIKIQIYANQATLLKLNSIKEPKRLRTKTVSINATAK